LYEGQFTIAAETANPDRADSAAHLEEDAGKLMHEAPGGYAIDPSIVDLTAPAPPCWRS